MKRLVSVFFTVIIVMLLAGSVFAQEMMEKTDEEKDIRSPMMAPGTQGMMGMPMMQQMMGGQGMMSGSGMMAGGMMCPMCGRMMTGSGMMGMGQMPMMGRGMMMGGMGMMSGMADWMDKLDLSEEQMVKIRGIFADHRKDMIRMNADREIAEIDLGELTQQEEPDLNAIEVLVRKVADLEASMRLSQIKVWMNAKSVLTEEQKANLKKLMKSSTAPVEDVKKDEPVMPGSGGYMEHHE